MNNTKTQKIVTHLEYTLYKAAKIVIDQEEISQSAYVRQCVMKDLINRGLITPEMIFDLAK